jgi:hypothetical protein
MDILISTFVQLKNFIIRVENRGYLFDLAQLTTDLW